MKQKKKARPHNSRLPQVAVTCKIDSLCFYLALVQVDSLVLLNRHLRQAAKRYVPFEQAVLSAIRTTG
jgi:hypothetical protein